MTQIITDIWLTKVFLFKVAIEENNRNTLTQLSKFKKFQSQISEDFTKQFSVLEKLLDEFTTGARDESDKEMKNS